MADPAPATAPTIPPTIPPTAAPFPCPACGHLVEEADPADDWMCASCGEVHFAKGALPASVADHRLPLEAPASVHPEAMSIDGGRTIAQPADRVLGHPRPFWSCLALGVVTVGAYFLFYQAQAFREVDGQAGRRHHAGLFGLFLLWGLFAAALVATAPEPGGLLSLGTGREVMQAVLATGALAAHLAYLAYEVANLNHAREALGLERAAHPATLPAAIAVAAIPLWFPIPGIAGLVPLILLLAVELLAWGIACAGINEYWQALDSHGSFAQLATSPPRESPERGQSR